MLAPHVPAAALEGLEEFSHVWVLYIFHANTNLGERLGEAARASSAMAKVHVRAQLPPPHHLLRASKVNAATQALVLTRAPGRRCRG